MSLKDSFSDLREGNKVYARTFGKGYRPGYIEIQRPHTSVLCCSDSRVPIEQIFNLQAGEVFVVREAGHVPQENSLASLEFSITSLGIKNLLVLGHTQCGAVNATLSNQDLGSENLNKLASIIRKNINLDSNLDEAIKQNAENTINLLRKSKIIADAIDSGRIKYTYGIYNIMNGNVTIY